MVPLHTQTNVKSLSGDNAASALMKTEKASQWSAKRLLADQLS